MLYCFDINRRIFVDNDSHFRATPQAGRPSFFAGDTITLILQPVSDAEFFTFPAGTIFTVAIDNNFLPDDVLMASAECELYAGKIQVTLNCNTESFIAKVSTRNTAAIIEIVAYEPGDTQGKTILQTDILCSPRISTQATPPAVVTPEYLTAAETRALIKGLTDYGDGTYSTQYSRNSIKQFQHENYYSGPMLIIIDDDCYRNFIDSGIADMYRAKGVRCSIAAVACRAEAVTGTTTSGDPYVAMSWDELSELAEDGFEIINHSYSHDVNVFPRTANATEAQFIYEYEESLKLFLKNGFNPKTIVYPWGNPTTIGSEAARKYFKYGVLYNGSGKTVDFNGLNYLRVPRGTAIGLDAVKAELDACAANNSVMIWGTHSYGTGPQPSLAVLTQIIDYAISLGIRIEPFERAMRLRQPVIDCGISDSTRIAINADGTFNDLFVTRLISRANALGLLNGGGSVISVTGIAVSGSSTITDSGTLTATVTPATATNPAVTWSSSATSIATINQSGNVTVLASGNVTFTATAQDGSGVTGTKTVSCVKTPATVAVTGIVVNGGNPITDSGTLTATVTPSDASSPVVTWSSSNTSLATIDSAGNVVVLADGSVTFTATAQDGSGVTGSKTVSCIKTPITVAVTGIAVSGADSITDSGSLTATVTPSNASNANVTWSSSNSNLATINQSGEITVLADGSVTFTATAQDGSGVTGSKTVFCLKTPAVVMVTGIVVSGADSITDSGTLTATVTPSDAANSAVTWSSSDDSKATIDQPVRQCYRAGHRQCNFRRYGSRRFKRVRQ